MNRQRLLFWIPTGLLSLMMLASAGMSFFKPVDVRAEFQFLGFPAWLIFPLGLAKLAGVMAITTRLNKTLAEWAYAGFFFDFSLAIMAHIQAGDGDYPAAIAALVLLGASRFWADRVQV